MRWISLQVVRCWESVTDRQVRNDYFGALVQALKSSLSTLTVRALRRYFVTYTSDRMRCKDIRAETTYYMRCPSRLLLPLLAIFDDLSGEPRRDDSGGLNVCVPGLVEIASLLASACAA
jgi:hypothetical protein